MAGIVLLVQEASGTADVSHRTGLGTLKGVCLLVEVAQ